MSNIYDVIIIGAGPAGLNCAYHLQNTDKKILVIEKNKVIGPKICAGGLTQKDLEYLNLPAEIIGKSFNQIIYNTRLQKTKIARPKPFIYTVDRRKLGQWQLHRINQSKIEIITDTVIQKINNGHIIDKNNNKYYFKNLVGADGSVSLVRRYLRLKSEILGIGIQYIIPSNKYTNFELHYNSKFFSSWYSWIFPHSNFVSIGTGGDPKKISSKIMHQNLLNWMKYKNIDWSQGRLEAFPINNDYQGYKFNNIYLAGDAAGLASEFNGEGIYQALISGEEIAHNIINPDYKSNKINNILATKKRHTQVLKVLNMSGRLRPILLELIGLGFHSKYLTNKAFKYVLS